MKTRRIPHIKTGKIYERKLLDEYVQEEMSKHLNNNMALILFFFFKNDLIVLLYSRALTQVQKLKNCSRTL